MLCWDSSLFGGLFYVCMVLAILVKVPIFMTHLWHPRTHVEAPVSGSLILTGVLLKLGTLCSALRNVGCENTFPFLVIKSLQEFSFHAISNANYLELRFNGLQSQVVILLEI